MKKLLLATLLFSQSSLSLAISNEDTDRYTFEAGKNKYMHTIGFDSATTSYNLLDQYSYYHNNPTVMIGIFDAGYYFDHEDLKNTLTKGTNRKSTHGTLIAGIIGAEKGNGLGYTGLVKPKKMYGISIFDRSTNKGKRSYVKSVCSYFDVINMSFELSSLSYSYKTINFNDSKHLNVMKLWRDTFMSPECSKTTFIIAAGNSNVDSRKENGGIQYVKYIPSGEYKYIPLPNVIVVGAIQGNEITQNYGESVDIYAPEYVGGPRKTYNGTSLYTTNNGTSVAAPQVTGAAALIQCEIKRNPARLKQYLTTKANLTMINKVRGTTTATTSRPILNIYKIVKKVVNDFGPGI